LRGYRAAVPTLFFKGDFVVTPGDVDSVLWQEEYERPHEDELACARDEAPNEAVYLLKPFDSEDLMLALRAAVNGNEISEETQI
jgi:hypothetical protein